MDNYEINITEDVDVIEISIQEDVDLIEIIVDENGIGIVGPQGPQGIQGEQGPQGIQGEQGPQGDPAIASEAGDSIFFLEDQNADIAGYKVMDNPAQLLAEAYTVLNTIVDGEIIEEFITDIGQPNIAFIPNGPWAFHINAFKTGGTKEVRIYNEFYKRDLVGTETLLETTVNSIALTEVEVALPEIIAYVTGLIFSETDRIVIKPRIKLIGGGSNPTSVTIGYSGSTAARLAIPSQNRGIIVSNITIAGSFTVTPAHHNVTIDITGTTPTITFDPNTQAYPNNFVVYFMKLDATDATITFTAAAGWTYREGATTPVASGSFTLTGEGGMCGVLRTGSENLLKLLGNA